MDIVTVGLFFGDEAKGSIVDFLACQSPHNIIRYSGGSQCAHNVVSNEIHHTFSQFGSGTLSGLPTVLSKFMLVDPLALMYESELLETKGINKPLENVYVSENCVVITPFQILCGRARENFREKKHGTCGKGVGETISDLKANPNMVIRVKDLNKNDLEYRLKSLRAMKLDQMEQLETNDKLNKSFVQYSIVELAKLYRQFWEQLKIISDDEFTEMLQKNNNIWEGAQGSLLDIKYGFAPYVTKTNTTVKNAKELLGEKKFINLGIMRAYATRHGNGPFPTEDKNLDLEEDYNQTNEWQGKFRVGNLDLVLTKYAISINNGIDKIALSCLDKLSSLTEIKVCLAYEYTGNESLDYLRKYFDFDNKGKIIGLKVQQQNEIISKLLQKCRPIYTSLPGWQTDISKIKDKKDLPIQVTNLINYIEKQLTVSIDLISVGPDRSQKMFLKNDPQREIL